MFNILKKILGSIFSPVTMYDIPTPIKNLKRARSNVKITWENSDSPGVVSQRIVVISKGKVIIEKDLAPETEAFSFSIMKTTPIEVSIAPYNGEAYGNFEKISFEV